MSALSYSPEHGAESATTDLTTARATYAMSRSTTPLPRFSLLLLLLYTADATVLPLYLCFASLGTLLLRRESKRLINAAFMHRNRL